MTPPTAARAHAALDRVRDLLQHLHEAARDFEGEMPPGRHLHTELLTDCIHRVRQAVESVSTQIAPSAQPGR